MDKLELATLIRSIWLFVLAGIFEIAGGYMVWIWLRDARTAWFGALGGLLLFIYAVLPTMQPDEMNFARVYAAYGGMFIALSLVWGWVVDGQRPDRFDIGGAVVALIGAAIIVYAPRS